MSADSPLYFIHPRVLKRLRSGQFVPARKSKVGTLQLESAPSSDRRHILSPLSVTKRCIPYQPAVFFHRHKAILQLAEHLNTPKTRVLLMDGKPGSGKTSLMRALVEMMGSQDEQVLWFDINPHSTVDDMVRFFIEYLEQLSHLFSDNNPSHTQEARASLHSNNAKDRLRALKQQFQAISHIPILIVLDHIEHQVETESGTLQSNTLRELLNFLLGFPNIKLCLLGQTLPHQDISTQPPTIVQYTVSPLPPQTCLPYIIEKNNIKKDTLKQSPETWQHQMGNPWNLNAWLFYRQHQQTSKQNLITPNWLYHILDELSDDEKQIAQLFSTVRHPLNIGELAWLSHQLKQTGIQLSSPPPITPEAVQNFRKELKTSLLKPWFKRFIPPQTVLLALYKGEQPDHKPAHEFQMSRLPLEYIDEQFDETERKQLHEKLSELYLAQKDASLTTETNPRILSLSNSQLIHEARYHQEQAKYYAALIQSDKPTSTHQGQHPRFSEPSTTDPHDPNDAFEFLDDENEFNDIHHQPNLSLSHPTDTSNIPHSGSPIIIQATHEQLAALSPHSENPSLHTLTEQEQQALGMSIGMGIGISTSTGIDSHPIHLAKLTEPSQPLNTQSTPTPKKVPYSEPEQHPSQEESSNAHIKHKETSDQPSEHLLLYRHQLRQAVKQQKEQAIRCALFNLLFQAITDQHQDTVTACLKQLHTKQLTSYEQATLAYAHGLLSKQEYQYRNAFTHLNRCQQILDSLPQHPAPLIPKHLLSLPLRAQLDAHRGEMYRLWDDPDQAAQSFQQCLTHLERYEKESKEKDSPIGPKQHAELFFKLARSLDESGQAEAAWNAYHQSIQWNEQGLKEIPNDPSLLFALASANANIAHLCTEHAQWTQAEAYFTQALHYDTLQGNIRGQFETLLQLGQTSLKQNNYSKANHYYQQALQLATDKAPKDKQATWQAFVHQWLAETASQQGNLNAANQHLKTVQALAPQLLEHPSQHHTLYELTEESNPS